MSAGRAFAPRRALFRVLPWAASLARATSGNHGTFMRDYSSFGYGGGYGHTDWREAGADCWGSGDANMLVEAVPEPAGLIALCAGILAVMRRRR